LIYLRQLGSRDHRASILLPIEMYRSCKPGKSLFTPNQHCKSPLCSGVGHCSSTRGRCRIVNRTRRVPSRYGNSGRPVPSAIVIHPSLALLLAVCSRADIGGTVRPWILKVERRRRWAADRAAIKAEVKRAKETVDLIGIARAITRLTRSRPRSRRLRKRSQQTGIKL
jgi:hypothetical protein